MTVIVKVIKRIMKFSGGLLDATSSLGEWINGISKSITKSNVFGKSIKKIINILDEVISKIKEFIEYVKQKFVTPGFDAFFVVAEKIWSSVSKIVKVVGKALSSVIKELGNAFRNGDIKSLVDNIREKSNKLGNATIKLKDLQDGIIANCSLNDFRISFALLPAVSPKSKFLMLSLL